MADAFPAGLAVRLPVLVDALALVVVLVVLVLPGVVVVREECVPAVADPVLVLPETSAAGCAGVADGRLPDRATCARNGTIA